MNVRVASFGDVEPSSVVRVTAVDASGVGHHVALVRIGDDLYGIGDTCSHAEVSLAEGTLWSDERELECPKHGSAFSLTDGCPQSLPATKPVPVYDVVRNGDDIELVLP